MRSTLHCFWSEINISAVTHSYEINSSSFLKWNQHLRSQAFSWNPYFTLQHLCSHAFSWNQHFTVFEEKSTPLRSHILNIFELKCWHENQCFTVFEDKSTSLTLRADVKLTFHCFWGVASISGQVLRSTSHMIIRTQQIIIFGGPEQI